MSLKVLWNLISAKKEKEKGQLFAEILVVQDCQETFNTKYVIYKESKNKSVVHRGIFICTFWSKYYSYYYYCFAGAAFNFEVCTKLHQFCHQIPILDSVKVYIYNNISFPMEHVFFFVFYPFYCLLPILMIYLSLIL
ncbi:hypothetical protein J3Q64DRAFT_1774972 [Phycomyces blakesleeanus]|uniref:DDE Tnp4 domain-containing protein n=1 Tax=Phycomyces blakesleeanus TaxID=4837 RepID=A0ABR3AIV8_PHYBL